MKLKTAIATGAIAMALTLTAHARLGETQEQIEERYGPPIGEGVYPNSMKYRAKGMDITVVYIDGKSACERFDTHQVFLLDHLIEGNGGTDAWKKEVSNRKTLGINAWPNSWMVRKDGAVAFIKDEKPAYIEIRTAQYNALNPIPEKPSKPANADAPRPTIHPLRSGKPMF